MIYMYSFHGKIKAFNGYLLVIYWSKDALNLLWGHEVESQSDVYFSYFIFSGVYNLYTKKNLTSVALSAEAGPLGLCENCLVSLMSMGLEWSTLESLTVYFFIVAYIAQIAWEIERHWLGNLGNLGGK